MTSNTHQRLESTDTTHQLHGVHHADARQLKSYLSQQAGHELNYPIFDTVLTSPPYADQKDYGYDEDLQVGFGDSYADYLNELRRIFKQTYELTKPTGTLWVVANTLKRDGRTIQLPFDIAEICENLPNYTDCAKCGTRLDRDRATRDLVCPACGWDSEALTDSWQLQDIIIWDKVRARPWSSKGSMRNVFEYILCFSKTPDFTFDLDAVRIADPAEFKDWWVDYPHRYNPRGKVPDNIWTMLTPNQGAYGDGTLDHPAPFPPKLVERIIRLTTDQDDTVFDPFAGTGTVLAKADTMGRTPVGLELSEEYIAAYPDIRDTIARQQRDDDESVEAQQSRLLDVLCGLREIRYARELIRTTRQQLDNPSLTDLGVKALLNISEGAAESDPELDRHYVESHYWVLTSDKTNVPPGFEQALHKAMESAPCSTFGIDATLQVIPITELSDEVSDWVGTKLFLYTDDTQHQYSEEFTLTEFIEQVTTPGWLDTTAKRQNPAILSNVGLEVTNPSNIPSAQDEPHSVKRRYQGGKVTSTVLE